MSRSSWNHCLLAAIGMALIATACQDVPDAAVEHPASVELEIDLGSAKAPGTARFKDLADASALVVSIEDAAGTSVYSAERMELYDFGGVFLSPPLSLLPGSYVLTELLLVDATGRVLYAAPVEGSELAYLVADPLGISFDVVRDEVSAVRTEVLSTEAQVPEDFGYGSFEPVVVDVLDFLVDVFVYDATTGALAMTTAAIEVDDRLGSVLYSGSLDARTSHVRVPGGYATYGVRITKPGHVPHAQELSEAELAAYFDSATGGPLTVVLHEEEAPSVMEEYAAFATNAALDWEHFQIGAEHYLAVANFYDGSTYNLDSTLYRWDGSAFVEAQRLATSGASDWEHFQIGTEHFLAVANHRDDSTASVDSKIYRWDGSAFVEAQGIATSGALDWEHLQIGAEHYLVVANHYDGSTYNLDSKIYRWDGSAFVEAQGIATSGAYDWKHLQIGAEHFLAVANYWDGSSLNVDSKIYRWDGSAFVEAQGIATSGALDWEHFQIGTEHYLAVANFYNGSTVDLDSKIYRWDGAAFVEAQGIATIGALDWEHFQVGTEHYLAVANQYDGPDNLASRLYRWDGAAFVEVQGIATSMAAKWEHFQIGTEHYLAVANQYDGSTVNIDSKLYRLLLD